MDSQMYRDLITKHKWLTEALAYMLRCTYFRDRKWHWHFVESHLEVHVEDEQFLNERFNRGRFLSLQSVIISNFSPGVAFLDRENVGISLYTIHLKVWDPETKVLVYDEVKWIKTGDTVHEALQAERHHIREGDIERKPVIVAVAVVHKHEHKAGNKYFVEIFMLPPDFGSFV